MRGLADAVRGDRAGIGRAFLIVAGLVITTTGYLVGVVRRGPIVSARGTA